MKKCLFTIVLMGALASPVFAETEIANNNDVLPIQTSTIPYKEPLSKRKLATKFLYAMSGAVISSLILFIGLSLYNKIRRRVLKVAENDYINTLSSPNNFKDAVNIYLEKTKE